MDTLRFEALLLILVSIFTSFLQLLLILVSLLPASKNMGIK